MIPVRSALTYFVVMALIAIQPQADAAQENMALPEILQPHRDVLKEEFFPGLEELPLETIVWAGLARLYPGTLLEAPPQPEYRPETAEPIVAVLPGEIRYVRVRDLQTALPELKKWADEPTLIIDLRFVYGDYPISLEFASIWTARADEQVEAVGTIEVQANPPESSAIVRRQRAEPVIILVNKRTAGALEAFVDALQSSGRCVAVGTPTAGMTGSYRQLDNPTGYWIVQGEWMARGGESLLSKGMQPEVMVSVSAEADYQAYQRAPRGVPLERTLRGDWPLQGLSGANGETADNALGHDRILQRAFEIIVALQILGKLPRF